MNVPTPAARAEAASPAALGTVGVRERIFTILRAAHCTGPVRSCEVGSVFFLDEFREERAVMAKQRFDDAWSNRAQNWRALELALDDLDVAVALCGPVVCADD